MQSQHAEGYGVEIEKTSNGLGLSLEGGSDTSSINAPVKIKLIKVLELKYPRYIREGGRVKRALEFVHNNYDSSKAIRDPRSPKCC